MAEVKWRVTREVEKQDIRCDLCGAPADTLHFVPYVIECEQVIFACPGHAPVPEGYWLDLDRWFGPEGEQLHDHVARKGGETHYEAGTGGDHSLALLYDRFFAIKCELAIGRAE
jgi:hypothetical protein